MVMFLDEDDDWIERVRKNWYPWLHKYLPDGLYAEGLVRYNQYVGTCYEKEDVIESELVEHANFIRNPLAAYKRTPDGRESEGSWVLWHEHNPDLVEPGMQLHVTLFRRERGRVGRELFAHYEDDWRTSPLKHLRGANFQPELGARRARKLIDMDTHLTLRNYNKYD
jgi:hypothetical protein